MTNKSNVTQRVSTGRLQEHRLLFACDPLGPLPNHLHQYCTGSSTLHILVPARAAGSRARRKVEQ